MRVWSVSRVAVACAVAVVSAATPAVASSQTISADSAIKKQAAKVDSAARRVLAHVWNEMMKDPAMLNRGLEALTGSSEKLRLLENLNLRFISFESEDGGTAGLGFAYSLSRDLARSTFKQAGADEIGGALSLTASGNVAFDRTVNPRDFLTSDASFHLYGSKGGVNESTPTSDAVRTRLNELVQKMALITTLPDLLSHPATNEFLAIMQEALTTHFYWNVAASGRLESDQSFQQRQTVYAAVLGLDISAPRFADFNLVDWPFAILRWLNGSDKELRVRGSTFPSVQVEIASVNPKEDTDRELLGEMDPYPRFRFEGGFRTPIFISTDGSRIFFDGNYRMYRELGASAAVKSAGLDMFKYAAAALVSDEGPFVSYSRGRLPFDRLKDNVFQLGFKVDF